MHSLEDELSNEYKRVHLKPTLFGQNRQKRKNDQKSFIFLVWSLFICSFVAYTHMSVLSFSTSSSIDLQVYHIFGLRIC